MAKPKFDNNRIRFKELAEARTNNIIKGVRILSHCSNKKLYEYNQEEIEKIFTAINTEIIEAKIKFQDIKKKRFNL